MAAGQEMTGTEIGGAAGAVVSFLVAVTGLLRLNTRVVEAEERGEEVWLEVTRDPVAWAAFSSRTE